MAMAARVRKNQPLYRDWAGTGPEYRLFQRNCHVFSNQAFLGAIGDILSFLCGPGGAACEENDAMIWANYNSSDESNIR